MLSNKKGFKLKATLIMLICLLVGLSCASFFAYRQNQNNNAQNLSIETSASNQVDENVQSSSFTMKWSKDPLNKIIKPMSITGNTDQYIDPYYITYGEGLSSGSTIPGGTKLIVSYLNSTNGPGFILTFEGVGTISVAPCLGYEIISIGIGYKDAPTEGVQTVTLNEVLSDSKIFDSIDDIDPNYTGELSFKVNTSAIPYGLDLYYRTNEAENKFLDLDSDKYDIEYNIEQEGNLASPSIAPPSDAEAFKGWVFDATVAGENGYDITENADSTLTVTKTDLNLTFKYSSELTNVDNHTYYFVEKVKGYGDFVQNPNAPIITAGWTNKYEITLEANSSFWNDGNKVSLPTGVTGEMLYGAYSKSGSNAETGNASSTKFVIADDAAGTAYNYKFMDDQMVIDHSVFQLKAEFDNSSNAVKTGDNNSYYYVFNYGHYIAEYTVKVGSKYLTLSTTVSGEEKVITWDLVANSSIINSTVTDADTTFNKIAEYLDTKYQGDVELPTIIITPTWEKQPFSVEYGNTNIISNLVVGDEYELTELPKDGQTMVAYKSTTASTSDDYLIAQSGVWTYCTSDAPEMYSYESNSYVVKVEPRFVNDIYKVTLNGEFEYSTGSYELNASQSFHNIANDFEATLYTFKNEIKSNSGSIPWKNLGAYSSGSIDTYIANLKTKLSEWEIKSNPNSENPFEFIKEVHYNGSSNRLSADYLVSSDVSEFYIYLTHNQAYNKTLPSFVHDYKNLIFWTTTNNKAFTTTSYDNKWKKEISENSYSISDDSIWTKDCGTTLSPYYLHRVDLWYETYEDVDTEFERPYWGNIKSQWYGNHTSNNVDELVDADSDGEPETIKGVSSRKPETTFGCWMFNATVATTAGWKGTGTDNAIICENLTDDDKSLFKEEERNSIEGKIQINKGSITLIMYVDCKNPFYNYYYISHLQGTGIITQDSASPFLTAKWSTIYDLTIDNSNANSVWKGKTIQYDADGDGNIERSSNLREDEENHQYQLLGAYSSLDTDDDCTGKITFKIANSSSYAYAFMDSTTKELSFYKYNDFGTNQLDDIAPHAGSNYYFVYNYGYYISGWILKFDDTHYLSYDGTNWSLTNSSDGIDISMLTGSNASTLADLAENANEYFAYSLGTRQLTIYPVWKAVNIKAVTNPSATDANGKDYEVPEKTVIETSFNSNYFVDSNSFVTPPTGQLVFCYKDNSDNYIASVLNSNSYSGKWNYYSIPTGNYEYASDGTNSYYTIQVTPVFVNNIYQVTLNGVKVSSTNTYTLTSGAEGDNGNCGYTFNSSTGTQGTELTFQNSFTGYTFSPWSEGLMDDYIPKLIGWQNTYNEGINGNGTSDFDIFRKVYYSDGTVDVDNNGTQENEEFYNLSIAENVTPTFSIYLANGQKTGEMPVFKKDYYELIFWENDYEGSCDCTKDENGNLINGKFAYITHNYDYEIHSGDIDSFIYHNSTTGTKIVKQTAGIDTETTEDDTFDYYDYIWYFSDGNQNKESTSFTTHYFRKYYILDIETLFKEEINRKGYVYVDIDDTVYAADGGKTMTDDENMSGEYIIIAEYNSTEDKYEMKIYKVSDDSLVGGSGYGDETKITNELKLYEGCDLTFKVKDQSQDVNAMASGNFDEMIGYKFDSTSGLTQKVNQTLIDFEEDKPLKINEESEDKPYDYFSSAADVSGLNLKSGDIIGIQVPFVKIQYTISFKLDDSTAGEFKVFNTVNGVETVTSYLNGSHTLTDQVVGNSMSVIYYAFAGYTLEANSFVLIKPLNGTEVTLQTFDDAQTSTMADQTYYVKKDHEDNLYDDENMFFFGTWLRTYFYNKEDRCYKDYGVDKTDIGTIEIRTMPIQFTLGVKIYESDVNNGRTTFNPLKIDNTLGTFKLNDGKGSTTSFSSRLKNETLGWYYYNHFDSDTTAFKKYALLSSRMYFPNKLYETVDNHYTTYDFLLTTEPTNTFELYSSMLANMVENYETQKIISPLDNNRTIYIMLEVRELLEIEMKVEKADYDTNSTSRTTTLTNGTNNSQSLALSSDSNFDEKQTVYTYKSLTNTLSSTFDENHYSEVKYYLDGVELKSNSFEVESNAKLTIKYIPETLDIVYSYTLDGVEKSYEEMVSGGYLTDNHASISNDWVVGGTFAYIPQVHADYDVSVTINGSSISPDSNSYTYTVQATDFDYGQISVLTELTLKDNSKINVKFQLVDSSKKTLNDDIGTFTVFENTKPLDSNLTIIEGRDVYFKLNLNAGYTFVGIKHNTDDMVEKDNLTLDSTYGYKVIESYNPDEDGGNYWISVDKVAITATLNTTNLKAKYYINGKILLSNLYVGQTIDFTYVEVSQERLDYFYYTYKENAGLANEQTVTVELKNLDGTPKTQFEITSDVLERCGTTINFGVKTVNRYKLNLNVVGEDYLQELTLTNSATNENYISGTYCDEGTTINIKATTKALNKYVITFDSTSDYTLDTSVTLTADLSKTLTVAPKEFTITVDENVYTTLTQIDTNTPEDETDGVNGILESDKTQKYNVQATIEFKKLVEDRELYEIHLSGNDDLPTGGIVIRFEGNSYKAMLNETEIQLADYNLSLQITSYGTVKLTYIPQSDLTIKLDYKLYKMIEA